MEKNSKIYIAGHKGLVGSAIKKALESDGYTNIIYKTKEELNLLNQQDVADFFEKERPEYVFLAAALVGGIAANEKFPGAFIYENLQIQNNVIFQSHMNNVAKLLFLGSTCIYPKELPQPIKEDYLLTGSLEKTNEAYAIAKIAGLKMCEYFNKQYETNFISVMPTNLYGDNDNFDLSTSHVFPALFRKIFLGKALEENDWITIAKDIKIKSSEIPILKQLSKWGIRKKDDGSVEIEIWGSGKPRREFMHSEDMASACIYIMNCKSAVSPINIGTGIDISISELAFAIKDELGYKGGFFFNSSKPDGTMLKRTDPSKLHSLGWKHTIELRDGIQKVKKSYSQILNRSLKRKLSC